MKEFYISASGASGAIQGHHGPLVVENGESAGNQACLRNLPRPNFLEFYFGLGQIEILLWSRQIQNLPRPNWLVGCIGV